ncbi:MAG: MoaD/ThiS family protein [Bacillota bacterium]
MKIKVKLINQFKKYGKDKLDDNRKLEIDNNYFVKDLVKYFKIPEDKNKIILANGRNVDMNYKIKEGDEIIIYNLIAGG